MVENILCDNKKINILVIVGPTACGKTKLSVEIAKQFNAEIISADSMQIYKQMNIGTAKPSNLEMQGIPHHLIDFIEVDQEFSVAQYVNLARDCIRDINNRGKLPMVVGGTGLYINSLIDNINFVEQKSNPDLRKSLWNRYRLEGVQPLLDELAAFDEKSSENLSLNTNILRIIRAIEIYKVTGITMSQQIENSKKIVSPYNPIMIGLNFIDRSILYNRINKRVDKMINLGLIDETRKVLSLNCSKTAANAICYKELAPYIYGECTLGDAIENLKRQTRRYAKRQITWFKRDNRINWIYIDAYTEFKEVLNYCTKTLEILKNM